MNKKKIVNVMLGVLALLLIAGMAFQFTPNVGELFNRTTGTPALTVNGTAVTVEELEAARRANPVLASADTGVLGDDFKTFVVAQQIQQTLVRNAVKDIRVSRADVAAKVTEVREANQLTDSKAWTDALQGAGLTDSSYREQVRQSLAIERRVEEIKKGVPAATDAELRAYYDLNTDKFQTDARIQGRQIVVADRARAQALLKQAQGGADFASLARASSEFADRGGALGPLENGVPRPVAQVALPSEVGTAAFALTGGGLTDVIESGGKFYIVKVEKYLAPAPKPFADARGDLSTAVNEQKKNAAVEAWVAGLEKDARIEFKDLNWKVEDPTVATIAGQNIPYSKVIEQVVNNQQFTALLQQVQPEQAAQLVNSILKPQVTQQLLAGYAAPTIVERLKLNLTGTQQELSAGVAAYGARNVKVTDADVSGFYTQNREQFQTPASGSVLEASFKTQAAALAFRNSYGGQTDFAAAAGKAGGTVSERGSVTAGDGKLSEELSAAVFEARTLRDAGEGSLTDPVKVGERYSVAFVTDLKPAATQPLSAVRAQIESQVLAQKRSEEGQKFLESQVASLKPKNNLQTVLAAQQKRVDAQTPKAAPATEDSSGQDSAAPAGDEPPAAEGETPAAPPADQ